MRWVNLESNFLQQDGLILCIEKGIALFRSDPRKNIPQKGFSNSFFEAYGGENAFLRCLGEGYTVLLFLGNPLNIRGWV